VKDVLLKQARALPQSVRFGLAGGVAAGVNWLVRFPLSALMPFLPAVLVAAVIGMVVGFVIYQKFVFPHSARRLALQIRDFVVVNLSTLLVATGSAMVFRSLLVPLLRVAVAEAAAHAAALAFAAVLNYVGHSTITFHDHRADS
jgi:putative flippase GtrA